MGSQELKNALRDAGITPEEFADAIQVDPKSVTRWLTGQSTPYPRHRAKIARALDRTEQALWPEVIGPEDHGSAATGQVNEVTATRTATREQTPHQLIRFIQDAGDDLDMTMDEIVVPVTSELIDAIVACAGSGHRVRLLTADIVRELEPLVTHPKVELRHAVDVPLIIARSGRSMLAVFNLEAGHSTSGILILERQQDDGWFDHLADSYEQAWKNQQDIVTDLEQFNRLVQAHDDAVEEDRQHDKHEGPGRDLDGEPAQGSQAGDPHDDPDGRIDPAADTKPTGGQRRWPRRPD